ncbi:hypothetical protein RK21_04803 [Pseudomonas plecoglossicida]|nr:hypothetical protein RK21_04803 [Pseudomonas plecoglossicida]
MRRLPDLASSRVNPLPQEYHCLEPVLIPVGAGLPAKAPAQIQSQTASQCG